MVQQQRDETLPAGVPCHSSLPHLSTWYTQQQALFHHGPATPIEDLENCRSSDKEVISPTPDMPTIKSPLIPNNEQGDAIPPRGHNGEVEQLEESHTAFVFETDSSSSISTGVGRSHSRLSSIRSSSIRNFSIRLSTRLSRSASHVNSVLSMTNSWRSSLVYAGSISSDRMSKTSEVPVSHREFLSWNELVDESKLATATSRQHPDYEAASLRNRPCCEFFENDTYKRTLCNVCGFSEMHHLARISLSDDGDSIDSRVLDRFGNIPLHHAAAAGNTARVLQLMCSAAQIRAQNTSGETFLHVFHLDSPERFPEYIEVLNKASNLSFPFFTRDYSGRTVVSRIDQAMDIWGIDSRLRTEVSRILTSVDTTTSSSRNGLNFKHILDGSGLPGAGKKVKEQKKPTFGLNQLKDALLHPKLRRAKPVEPNNNNLDANGDTKLISTLKRWPEKPLPRAQLEYLIQRSDIHMRDERGYTALAIAARHGLREAVWLLLKYGANPNTRSHEKTSVLEHAATHLARAQKENNDQLYARILSCIVLLTDHGAKAIVTVFDEYTWRPPPSIVDTKDFRMALSAQEMHTPLDTCGGDKYTLSELAAPAPSLGCFSELSARPASPKVCFLELDATNSTSKLVAATYCIPELPSRIDWMGLQALDMPHRMSDMPPISPISPTLRSFLSTVDEEDDALSSTFFPFWDKGKELDLHPPGNIQAPSTYTATPFYPSVNDIPLYYSEEPESYLFSMHTTFSSNPTNRSASPEKKLSQIAPQSQISFQATPDSLQYPIYDGNATASNPKWQASGLKRYRRTFHNSGQEKKHMCESCHLSFSRLDNLRAHTRARHPKSGQIGSSTLNPVEASTQTFGPTSPCGIALSRQKRRLSDEKSSTRPSRSNKYIKILPQEERGKDDISCNNGQRLSQGSNVSRDWGLDPGGFPFPARIPTGNENSAGIAIGTAADTGGSIHCRENALPQVWRSYMDDFFGHLVNESLSNEFPTWDVGEFRDPVSGVFVEQSPQNSSGLMSSIQSVQHTASQHTEYVSSEEMSRTDPDSPISTTQNSGDLYSCPLEEDRSRESLALGVPDLSGEVAFIGEQLQEPLETAVPPDSVCKPSLVYQRDMFAMNQRLS
jgi:ankyrin repeat protein